MQSNHQTLINPSFAYPNTAMSDPSTNLPFAYPKTAMSDPGTNPSFAYPNTAMSDPGTNSPFSYPNTAMSDIGTNPPFAYPTTAMSDPSKNPPFASRNTAMSDINRPYQVVPRPMMMSPSYDCNAEQCVQRIPWSEMQNSAAMLSYCKEVLRRGHAMGGEMNNPPKEFNHGTSMGTPRASDNFMMYNFKIQPCPTFRGHHDWTDCLYLHQGEKARRRNPQKVLYSGKPCADFRKRGQCENSDRCQFAHGVFETWLHPDKYKTQMCRDLGKCQRKVCFFAHSAEELREGDGVIDDMSGAFSPKSIFSIDQSPPNSPLETGTDNIIKGMEMLRLNASQNGVQYSGNAAAPHVNLNGVQNVVNAAPHVQRNIPHPKLYNNFSCLEPKRMETQYVEPNIDWVTDLLDFE